MDQNSGTIQPQLDALALNDEWAVGAAELILRHAEAASCSDVHVLCRPDDGSIRGRRHGSLFLMGRIPAERQEMLIARFKVLSRLSGFVRQTPQDGRIDWKSASDGRMVQLRVSFLPTIHGESLVVRFPQEESEIFDLERLGLPPEVLEGLDHLLARQEGMILVTGPTSSGKTTTLYAMMRRLYERHGEQLNFVTIEDPVERDLRFAAQVQVNEAQNLTFEKALRSALRHDPNVLLIGEIRDRETGLIAAQAGMSGGIVLSTMHAGRATRIPVRLLSMGLPPYLVASSLSGMMAQRLARLLCEQCLEIEGTRKIAKGCDACAGTGVKGRVGLFELVSVDEAMRAMILEQATPNQIAAHARHLQLGDLSGQVRALAEAGAISRLEEETLLMMSDEQGNDER